MKKYIVATLLLLAVFATQAQLNINHYIRVGRTRIAIGNYTGAIEYFNIVIKFKPYLPEPYFYRGEAKNQLEDYRGAILDFNKALEIKPYYPEALMLRGFAFYELKDYKSAINDYNAALELDPQNEGVYNNRGIAKMALKDFNGAIADYNKALEIEPQSVNALMNRSNANIVKGDVKEAINDLNKIIIIRPHYAGAYLNRGLARFEMDDYASALRDFDQAIKLDPKSAFAYNNRGIVKHKLEDYVGAIMDYDMALSLDPQQANAYFNRAMAKEILGRPGFESDYAIAAQLNPQYDLSRYQVDASQLAQNKQQGQQNQQNQQQQSQSSQGTTQQANNQSANNQQTQNDSKEKTDPSKRKKLNLMISDNRNLPEEEEEEVLDGRIQNKNIIIDLQPIFLISAYDKNSVDYDHFQYYNPVLEEVNQQNNYDPLLSASNRSEPAKTSLYGNYILAFNERLQKNASSFNFVNRGILRTLTGDYNSAISDLDRSIELDPKNVLAYFTRGNCRYKMVEHIETLTAGDNLSPVAINNRTDQTMQEPTAAQSEDYDRILEDYESALFLKPDFYFVYFNRAYINLRLRNYENAMADLNKAIEIEPEFAEAYYNRGLTKIYLDDLDAAAVDLSRAGELGLTSAYNVIKRYCN